MELSFYEIAGAVGATNDWQAWPDFSVTGAEFDSRKLAQGGLFVPLAGTRDGHDFLAAAVAKGAAATLWSRETAPELPYLQVEDVLTALQQLAKYYLQKVAPQVIAITGSNGKTTTKDMTASVLSTAFNTYKTQGNYNNQIGVPYTILQMPAATECLVLEMGMDHAGEINELSRLAEPDIAAITLIGESHLEHFGNRSGIAKAKMEIANGLNELGVLIVPADEPLLAPLMVDLTHPLITFGLDEVGDASATVTEQAQFHTKFTMTRFPGTEFTIPLPGVYNVRNALVAGIIGSQLGLTASQVAAGLANIQVTKNRTEWVKRHDGLEILSDVYNANPTAMALVLDSFSDIDAPARRIAVLGDMLELGPDSAALHGGMVDHLTPEKIQLVYLYGREMAHLYQRLVPIYGKQVQHFLDKEALIASLKTVVQPTDRLVVKASNGMGLNEVVAALMAE
ncbi:UDP-N-acetylmuramoyl-tripeptide--D-alanyl-D-alanine ligase [Enterococcus canis]|nr:UDP-N-acetylmuramoyl-tripeptide--D-alanyl-D-alanine ligase [Enterococcus canis]